MDCNAHPVSATVQEHADAFAGLEILHLGELERDIIDFTLYATFLQDRFKNDPLSKYYIPSRIENSETVLHSRISAWISSKSATPAAMWAGYGMGKTSYASLTRPTRCCYSAHYGRSASPDECSDIRGYSPPTFRCTHSG